MTPFLLYSLLLLSLLVFGTPRSSRSESQGSTGDENLPDWFKSKGGGSEGSDSDILEVSEEDDYSIDENISLDDLYTQPSSFADIRSHPDVTATAYFPDIQKISDLDTTSRNSKNTLKFPIGKPVTALIDVTNNSPQPFNITLLQGILVSPYDKDHYIFIYPPKSVERTVLGSKQQITLDYEMQSDSQLQPTDYRLEGYVLYNTSTGQIYKTQWYNKNIQLYDVSTYFDFQTISSWIMTIGLVTGTVYLLLNTFVPSILKGSGKKRYVSTSAGTTAASSKGSKKKK